MLVAISRLLSRSVSANRQAAATRTLLPFSHQKGSQQQATHSQTAPGIRLKTPQTDSPLAQVIRFFTQITQALYYTITSITPITSIISPTTLTHPPRGAIDPINSTGGGGGQVMSRHTSKSRPANILASTHPASESGGFNATPPPPRIFADFTPDFAPSPRS